MAESKTKPTDASIEDYLASRGSDEQRADCRELTSLMRRITKQEPKMWGPSIVGFGSYRHTYESGRTGTACLTGFAIRGREVVIYPAPYWADQSGLLADLGTHKMGKGCLYIRRLSDLNESVLEKLLAGSVAERRRRYGSKSDA